MPGRIVIVDPACDSLAGHHYTSLKVLERALAPGPVDFAISQGASEDLDFPTLQTHRIFNLHPLKIIGLRNKRQAAQNAGFLTRLRSVRWTRWIKGARRKKRSYDLSGTAYCHELRALWDSLSLGPLDQLIFSSATPDLVLSALAVAQQRGTSNCPFMHFRFLVPHYKGDALMSEHAMQELCNAITNGFRAKAYAQSRALCERLEKQYGFGHVPSVLLRYPHDLPIKKAPTAGAPLTIGCLGEPRREKNAERYREIFNIVLRLNAASESPLDLRFLAQTAWREEFSEFEPELRASLGPESERLTVLGAHLTIDEFGQALNRCDVMLLPYRQDVYRTRNSGIFLDALLQGIPAVVTRGTSMEAFMEHENGLTALDDQEFAQALLEILNNYVRFHQASARAAQHYRKEWCNNGLVEKVRALAEPQADLLSP